MKKIRNILVLLVAFMVFLTGCAQIDYTIQVKKDQSVQLQAQLLLDQDIYSYLAQTNIETYRQQLRSSGFTVSYITQDDKEGLLATIDLANLDALNQSPTNILPIQSMSYGEKGALFYNRFAIDLEIDPQSFVNTVTLVSDNTDDPVADTTTDEDTDVEMTDEEKETLQKQQEMENRMRNLSVNDLTMSVTVTMPQSVTAEGATLSGGNKTATWTLQSNGVNSLHLETVRVNWILLIFVLLIAVVCFAAFVMLFIQYRKGRQQVCKYCGAKNYYKRAACRRCGEKAPIRPRRLVHNQRLLSILAGVLCVAMLLVVLVAAMCTYLGKVPTEQVKSPEVTLADLINQISMTNQIVDPEKAVSVPEESQVDSAQDASSEEVSSEATSSQATGMTTSEKIEILIGVARSQEEELAKYSTDDYWDARSYLGNAYEPISTMQSLYSEDASAVDKVYDTYVQAGIIDRDGNVLSLLMGYKPSTQSSAISESQAIRNAENYLNNMALYVPANVEVSSSDDSTYTVHFYDQSGTTISNESWYRVDKYTGEVLSSY